MEENLVICFTLPFANKSSVLQSSHLSHCIWMAMGSFYLGKFLITWIAKGVGFLLPASINSINIILPSEFYHHTLWTLTLMLLLQWRNRSCHQTHSLVHPVLARRSVVVSCMGKPFPRLCLSPIKQETNLYVNKHRLFCVFVSSWFGPRKCSSHGTGTL
jgi:hypothetical protein